MKLIIRYAFKEWSTVASAVEHNAVETVEVSGDTRLGTVDAIVKAVVGEHQLVEAGFEVNGNFVGIEVE